MWAILVFFSVNFLIICGNIEEKCCDYNQIITEVNSTLLCGNSSNPRMESFFGKNAFLLKNIKGTCIELYEQHKTGIFSIDIGTKKISLQQEMNEQYFPKCCPIGHKYNKTFHSCEKSEGRDNLLISISNSTFVKIGLPECDIISDMFYQSFEDIKNHNEHILSDTRKVVGNGKFCLDETLGGDFVLRICESNAEICDKIRCIHKCCPDGQSYVNSPNCVDTFKFGVNLHSSGKVENPDDPFVVIHGTRKPFYFLDSYNFTIDRKGMLAIHMNETHKYFEVSDGQYCFEHLKRGTNNVYITLSPSSEPEIPMKFSITRWIKLISCIFLLLTISVYLIVPKMRNLFGKILLSYSVATFLMFFF
ncbi:hypothetical protein WA026_003160 [Henosepilachna vigintioctopunctata]|uniref:Methuselah N-terminal domain-containing protein n=1 Tax=Henosepilachna vigintioctopunctata TaxID=420089 RepID=A0AAW1TNS9_9CUCU